MCVKKKVSQRKNFKALLAQADWWRKTFQQTLSQIPMRTRRLLNEVHCGIYMDQIWIPAGPQCTQFQALRARPGICEKVYENLVLKRALI